MFLNRKLLIAVMAITSLFTADIAAYAGEAQATTAVNVRSGPGTNFKVLDRLTVNEKVDATECYQKSWCFIKHEGENGWVSAKYLTAVRNNNANTQGQNCKFIFKLDKNGPTFKMQCEETNNADNFGEGSNENKAKPTACFYTGINFSGTEACIGASTHNSLRNMNNAFASLRLYNGAAVKLCTGQSFTGKCRTYAQDKARLQNYIYKQAKSAKIFSQFQNAVVTPKLPNENRIIPNKKGGKAILRASQRLDLDTGKIGRAGADLQYARSSEGSLFLRAVNGAKFALINRGNVGYNGCSNAVYDINGLSSSQLPAGSYLCVKTNEGRLAQIQISKIGNGQLNLNFATFN